MGPFRSRLVVTALVAGSVVAAPHPALAAPDHTPPPRVTAVTATAGETRVKLSWTNPTVKDLAGVVIRRKAGAVAPKTPTAGTLVKKVIKPHHRAIDVGLTASSTYSYALFAYDTHHNFSRVTRSTVTTTADTHPPGPVTALAADSTDTQASLSWTNPTDQDFASIVARRAVGATAPSSPTDGQPVAAPAGEPTGLTDGGLDINTTYSYAVFALDTAGNTSASATVTIDTKDTPPGPVAITFVGMTDHEVGFLWTYPDDLDLAKVIIRRNVGPIAPSNPTEGTAAGEVDYDGDPENNGDWFTDHGLKANTLYSYALWTVDTSGSVGPRVSFMQGTDDDTTAPTPVTNLTATFIQNGIHLTWTNPTDPDLTGLIIRTREGVGGPPLTPEDGAAVAINGTPNEVTVPAILVPGNVYWYSVFTHDADGNHSERVTTGLVYNPGG